ncbi:MAG: tRNA pseudouridine(54/55) synthase Pus10 [Candidatus Micrarchaeota archaeon]|nr:tRNA pseudouridine(54/55) synthase Pus10 [Candidatus Micrarchaeota archaeon]
MSKIKFAKPRVCKRCWSRNGIKKISKEFMEKESHCKLCRGLFLKLDEIVDSILKEINSTGEIRTFSIGTSIPKASEVLEEQIWDYLNIKNAKSIKPELNAEIGKKIEKKSKYKFDPNPDIKIIYNVENGSVIKCLTPLYLYGTYNKLERGIRQTKKKGSKEESVEGLIEGVLANEVGTKGSKVILHGSGREDIDVLMLGSGRPFVAEITNPIKRDLNRKELEEISRKINGNCGKIKVDLKRVVDKEFVKIIKRAKFDKEYEAIVRLDAPIEKEELKLLPNQILLMQRTPKRVLIRRADKIRKRWIKNLESELVDEKTIKLKILSQSGTYIKEFISGDDGRTQPSVSSLLNRKAVCQQLNVTSIHSEWLDDFW